MTINIEQIQNNYLKALGQVDALDVQIQARKAENADCSDLIEQRIEADEVRALNQQELENAEAPFVIYTSNRKAISEADGGGTYVLRIFKNVGWGFNFEVQQHSLMPGSQALVVTPMERFESLSEAMTLADAA